MTVCKQGNKQTRKKNKCDISSSSYWILNEKEQRKKHIFLPFFCHDHPGEKHKFKKTHKFSVGRKKKSVHFFYRRIHNFLKRAKIKNR